MKRITPLTALITTILINSNLVWSQTQLFNDDFSTQSLDVTYKWRRGDNSTTAVTIVNGALQIIPPNDEAGWVVTQDAFPLSNTTITVKVLKANKDCNIGLCPSYPKLSNDLGIYEEANWYRFYIGRDNASDPDAAPYKLYAYKKKQGVLSNPSTFPLPSPFGNEGSPFYLRLRFDDAQIYFEYSTNDGSTWNTMYQEVFDLPAYSLNNAFHAEINSTSFDNSGSFKVDDFEVVSNSSTPMLARIILDDPLNSATFVNRKINPNNSALKVARSHFGSSTNFSVSGWKPSGDLNLVAYDLGRYIERGSLEIDVTQFEPALQNSMFRHHVLAMFRMPWGGHHPVEKIETLWDLHTGTDPNMGGGIKFYNHTYDYQDEFQTYVTDGTSDWDKTKIHHLTIYWEPNQIRYIHDGVARVTRPIINAFNNEMQLRYIYVGRDLTVSGDIETEFNHNQYKTMRDIDGPIYFNVVAKELRSTEGFLPSIYSFATVDLYDNAARISWQTAESTVCYVKYGTTTAYGLEANKMLGTPDISFTTLLTGLNPNQTYHYKVIAEDNAGNVSESSDQTFTTTNNGVYVFTPAADTYIERNSDAGTYSHLYGPTRALGNYGWMNLMSAHGRYCYLKFQIPNSLSNRMPRALRLHSRQGAQSSVKLYQFNPPSSNWESTVTWANQSSVEGQSGNGFQDSNGGITGPELGSIPDTIRTNQWYTFNFTSPASLVSTVEGNNIVYYFALQGTATTPPATAKLAQDVSFDSRESTNFQPELIVDTQTQAFTEVYTILPDVGYPALAWGDYDKDNDPDILLTGRLNSNLTPYSGIWRNDGNGNFTDINAQLQNIELGAVAWGDYDKNNFLDILLAGSDSDNDGNGNPYVKVYKNNGNATFTGISTVLQPVMNSAVAWGDYNNDRHVDILISGNSGGGAAFTKIYRSTSTGQWVATSISLVQLNETTAAAWGDYDKDGDLDILLAGFDVNAIGMIKIYKNKIYDNGTGPNPVSFQLAHTISPVVPYSCVWADYDQDGDLDITFTDGKPRIFEYNGTSYVDKNFSFPNLFYSGDVAWGDYDNDGDLDLLATGRDIPGLGTYGTAKIYRQDVNGSVRSFVDISAPILGVYDSSIGWGDYDKDGDLDILLAGSWSVNKFAVKLYRNNTTTVNNAPALPTNLSSVVTGNNVTLSWNPPSTIDETATSGLTYNIMMGTAAGGIGTVSPMSLTSNGRRLIPATGNVGSNTSWTMVGLPTGDYHWKVQTIDQTLKWSAFSTDGIFSITAKSAETDSLAEAQEAIPQSFALSPNYPNPFNPSTRLNLNLPENGRVVAVVYDLTGQEVVRLHDAEMAAGYKFLDWDGRNAAGTVASNGVYFVKVIFEGISGTRKESTSRVLLLK